MANNLESETRYVWAILGRKNSPLKKPFEFYYEKLKGWLSFDSEVYAFIGHDKDTDETGELKFKHIHLLIVLPAGRKPRLSTTLNKISNVVNIPREDIDIQIANNVGECIRYCIHRGYPLKYQYPIEELQTNLTEEELKNYFDVDLSNITIGYLLTCIKLCNYSCVEVMKNLGLKSYMKYRNVIKDVISEYKESNLE